jgi:predicted NUDIX family phosphoesterase
VTEEQVLVVPRSEVFAAIGTPDGWLGIRPDGLDAVVATIATSGRYAPRSVVEGDPDWKQVIPYPVLRDGERYFLMRRTRAGGDARLHDRYSIGIGGHLNPGDGADEGDLAAGMRREWDEEVVADFEPAFTFVGLLNDDTTDVGRVHLGVVFRADAGGRPVAIRETEKLSGAFVPPGDVAAVADRLETWSRLAFDFMETPPTVR